jgi:rsbT antagonist protein RsbS
MESDYNRIPIIAFWDLLLVPLQGDVTDDIAARLVAEVLERIHKTGASGLMIDITGLWLVDSHLCAVLSKLAAAASLMGARTIISGMKPEIAMALETMGVGLGDVTATLDLETALGLLGVRRPDLADGSNGGSGSDWATDSNRVNSQERFRVSDEAK